MTSPARRVAILASAVALAGAGCGLRPRTSYEANSQVLQLPSVVVYQGSTGSLSYQSAVGRDVQRLLPHQRAQGRVCQRGIQLPIFAALYAFGQARAGQGTWLSTGWGDGSYRAAMDDLRQHVPSGAVLYDVRADVDIRMILGVYREQCLVLDAGLLVPADTRAM
jgi:hypothetical protein